MLVYVSPFRFLKLIHGFLIKFYLKCYILFISLTYNHFMDSNYVADVCMGPIFWIIENFTNTIGRLLVMGVVSLTSSVVLIAYWIGLPYWWNRNPFICVFLTVFGNWILLNVVFNYFMACLIAPGNPPEGELISEAVSICKKCIAPKPPRTHHCSVCNRCILKMDHHCPWLNNCVGYRNHRYFYFYMVYTVLGVFYLIIAGYDIGYNAIFGDLMEDEEFDGHSVKINKTGALIPVTDTVELNPSLRTFYESTKQQQSEIITHNDLRRKSLIYMALLNVGVFVALGFLVTWHGQLITNNETSVETHINKAESIRMKEINNDDDGKLLLYINPYNLGAKKNWLQFLNLNSNRNFWIQILLPSIYQPPGNGLTWPTVRNNNNNKKELLLLARNNFKIEFKKCTK